MSLLGNILGGLAGGAVGFLTGGPAGAVAGAVTGSGILRGGGGGGVTRQPSPGFGGGQFGGMGGTGTGFNFPINIQPAPSDGGFGGSGAGGSFGPPPFPPPSNGAMLPGAKTGGVMPNSIVAARQVHTVTKPVPGMVTVTLPFAIGAFQAGEKVQMLREFAIRHRLWKPKKKPVLTAGDVATVRKADRVQNKLVRLTRKHTDFNCVSKVSAARKRAKASC